MKRRLYFLLPDTSHASTLVQELEQQGIKRRYIHTIYRQGGDPGDLAQAIPQLRGDKAARVEKILWLTNLAAFCMALLLLIVMALLQTGWPWLLLPVGIMLLSFLAGLGFTSRVPSVRLDRFRDAMRHAEVLLIIDVPVQQVARVEEIVHRHPEAADGGADWGIAHMTM